MKYIIGNQVYPRELSRTHFTKYLHIRWKVLLSLSARTAKAFRPTLYRWQLHVALICKRPALSVHCGFIWMSAALDCN
jgi:hypothetical protein